MADLSLASDRSKGPVSGILYRPDDAFALLVLAHGAGADMRHRFLAAVADGLAEEGVATLRFNFPYTEMRKRAPDPQPVLEAYVRSVCADARRLAPGLPLFAGGKSMGGRMTSNACAKQPIEGVRGLVFLGFPLHPPKKPATARGDHLAQVTVPMLFLQGTRDDLAEIGLVRELCAKLGPRATLREFAGANHSFEVTKASGTTGEAVRRSLAAVIGDWLRAAVAGQAERRPP
jgi:predicted alpha/beta-hydrolase family hydrolase